jgi:hypothetical protein
MLPNHAFKNGRAGKRGAAKRDTSGPMSRFDCPNCRRSLRWRLLPHVPQSNGLLAFSCIHCGAVLSYSEHELPVGGWFWKTRVRSVVTFIAGAALFSGIASVMGSAISLGLLALVAVILFAGYSVSSKPAYKLLNGDDANRSQHP